GQCVAALRQGCELHGVTLYPIVDDPGWLDHRRPHKALWNDADAGGHREPDPELLSELLRETPRLEAARATMLRERSLSNRER
ncbi:MAG: hypothetical protein K0S65_1502, partial [Labilithrix sp.]|nr:hypothetical protein [Labilithrix sp.]